MSMTTKAIKTGKQTDQPDARTVVLRGETYTIRELNVDEYDECLKAAEDENGNVPFGKLLRQMVARAVRPIPARPWKFPVYRTLESIVQEMHYTDVVDESEVSGEEETRPND